MPAPVKKEKLKLTDEQKKEFFRIGAVVPSGPELEEMITKQEEKPEE